ncbi:phage protein NinX family protein [Photorhabdus luminescens]|uniref:phage protein NinX family protein n=1 Tax=Photorhabdus luminescens TaxID=29488 RepID=UPI00223F8218|nr:DUF2591 domain-containing protein [Photorhabdus luminescens subsp. venezuelensis]
MSKIKTSELTGRALDYAVAVACEIDVTVDVGYPLTQQHKGWPPLIYNPSTDWSLCGQLIEKYGIELINELVNGHLVWSANSYYWSDDYLDGDTPQIAICRAVVAFRLCDEVEIPDELLDGKYDRET